MHIPRYTQHDTHYAAFEINRILMVNALGEYARIYEHNPAYHQHMSILQNIEFVTTLLNGSDERFTYDLRITSHPTPTQPNMGRISVHVIVAMCCDSATADAHALSIYQFLNAHFNDIVWHAVDDVRTVLHEVPGNYAVSLTRKSGYIMPSSPNTLHPFGIVQSASSRSKRARMFYVSPFLNSTTQHHALFAYLLQQHHPVCISMRMQRTQLTAKELRFCQDNLTTFDDVDSYPRAVAAQLMQYQHIMNMAMLRSYDMAVLLSIDIVSTGTIPHHLITLVGSLVTQPSGGLDKAPDAAMLQYHGGYRVIYHGDYAPVLHALQHVQMRPLDVVLTSDSDRLPHLFDASEAAMAFRLPRSSLVPFKGIDMQSHRQLNPPSDLSDTGTVIGQFTANGITQPIHISQIDRTRHAYIIGQTGTGKSTVLKSMILDDIAEGRGICAIDPHGDLVNDILAQIPAERHRDVIVIDPTQTDYPVGINVLEYKTPEERETVLMLFFSMMKQLQHDKGAQHARWTSPGWERYTRNNSYWVTQDINDPGTVIEFHQMMDNSHYYKRWLPINESDSKLVNWKNELEAIVDMHKADDTHSLSTSVNSQFDDFIYDTRLRLIFGQKHSTIDFFDAMNTQKIILVNLSRGLLSETASAFLGYIIITKLQQAALKRAELDPSQRSFFSIYVDEFQNYTTESFVSLLSESRKYGIALTMANQFLRQIENKKITSAILGNVGTIIAFRVGIEDGDELKPRFAPEVTPNDLINLPNWHAYVSTQVNGQSRRPFSVQTIRPREQLDVAARVALLTQSKHTYGTPRDTVEAEIAASMRMTRTPSRRPSIHPSASEATAGGYPYPLPHDTTTAAAAEPDTDFDIDTFLAELAEPSPTYTSQIYYVPAIHEVVKSSNAETQISLLHGAGLSMWVMERTQLQYFWQLGLHTAFTTMMHDVPIESLIPRTIERINPTSTPDDGDTLNTTFMQHHGNSYKHWRNINQGRTLQEILQRHHYDVQMGIEPDVAFLDELVALIMHQVHHIAGWRDIAISDGMVMVLDNHQCMWAWNNYYQSFAITQTDVIAIALIEEHTFVSNAGYMLKSDGSLWYVNVRGDIQHAHAVAPRHITQIVSNGTRLLAIDANHHHCMLDYQGQPANDDSIFKLPEQLPPIRCIAMGENHVTVIDTANTMWVWSGNHMAQSITTPPPTVDPASIVALAACRNCTFALDVHGKLHAWGYYDLYVSKESLAAMNNQGVRTISCAHDTLTCVTQTHVWYNNQSDAIPVHIDGASIIKAVRSNRGVWAAIRQPDQLHTLLQLHTQRLNTYSDLPPEMLAMLNDVNITSVYDVLQWTHTELSDLLTYYGQHDIVPVIRRIMSQLLETFPFLQQWPDKPINIALLASHDSSYGWYVRALLKSRTPDTEFIIKDVNGLIIPKHIADISIDSIDFTTRISLMLRRANITTLDQLLRLDSFLVYTKLHLNAELIDEIRAKLCEVCMVHGYDVSHWPPTSQRYKEYGLTDD